MTSERFSVRGILCRITWQDDIEIRPQVRVGKDHPASLGRFPDAVSLKVEELNAPVAFGRPEVGTVVTHHAFGIDGEVPFGKIVELFLPVGSQVIDLDAVFQSDGNEGIESDGADGQAAVGVCADSSVGQRELDDIRVGLCREVPAGRNKGIAREPVADAHERSRSFFGRSHKSFKPTGKRLDTALGTAIQSHVQQKDSNSCDMCPVKLHEDSLEFTFVQQK